MTNRRLRRAAARSNVVDLAPRRAPTMDGFQNVLLKLGDQGTALGASSWTKRGISVNKQLLDTLYRESWVCGNAVDAVAEDMTRAGIDLTGIEVDEASRLQSALTSQRVWQALTSTLKWARLYGGAAAFIMIDGQNPQTELDPATIRQDQFMGLKVFDRWQMNPLLSQGYMIDDGPEIGLPEFYQVPRLQLTIHHSRLLIFRGNELPNDEAEANSFWGMSIIERLYDRLVAFDSATQGTAHLVHRAYLRTVGIEGLREILSQGGVAEENLIKMFKLMAVLQSSEGITLLDKNDDFQTQSYTFSGLDDVLVQFAQQLAGATGIPLVRLLGQSPAGLNSTGEGDMRTYHENIAQKQESELRLKMQRVLDVMYPSVIGKEAPEDLDHEYRALKQLDNKEKADTADKLTKVVVEAYGDDLIDRPTAMRELQSIGSLTGVFTNITDEMVKEAEEMVKEAKANPPIGELDPLTGLPKPPPPALPGADPADPAAANDPKAPNAPPKQAPASGDR